MKYKILLKNGNIIEINDYIFYKLIEIWDTSYINTNVVLKIEDDDGCVIFSIISDEILCIFQECN